MAKELSGPDAELHACPVHAGARIAAVRLLNPADGRRGDVGLVVVGQIGSILKEDLSRHTSGHQRDAYDRSQGLYAVKPNYTAHNLKKETRKKHISGYARATQILVSIPAEVSVLVLGDRCHS
jgi:hypothetical protein